MEEYIIMDMIKVLSKEFQLEEKHIRSVVELLDSGNTVPFIARYRKEQS